MGQGRRCCGGAVRGEEEADLGQGRRWWGGGRHGAGEADLGQGRRACAPPAPSPALPSSPRLSSPSSCRVPPGERMARRVGAPAHQIARERAVEAGAGLDDARGAQKGARVRGQSERDCAVRG